VSINTDNPLTHASRLEDELAYAFHGLLAQTGSRSRSEDVLAHAIDAAWRSRFTLPASVDPETVEAVRAALGLVGDGRPPT
jgi:hypothetical protein